MRGSSSVSRVLLAALCAAGGVTPAQGQSAGDRPLWRPWRPVVSVGGGWLGADALGDATAETRAVTPGTTSPLPSTLFRTVSHLGGAPRADVGIAVPLTPRLAIEVSGTVARPTLRTRIQGDVENAPATTASERVAEYTLGGRATFELTRWEWGGRLRPFVSAGGAYLRQLHEGNVLVETGQVWSAGGGLRWWWSRRGPRRRPLGVAFEAGWSGRTGGIVFADGTRSMPWASLRAFAGL